MTMLPRRGSAKAAAPGVGRSASRISDEENLLMTGLCNGDEAAWMSLTRSYTGAMLRVARVYVSSHAIAEDVVRETWIAILNGVGGFEGRSSLKTWMFQILANKARSAGQREGRCVPDAALALREFDGHGSGISSERFLDSQHPQYALHWKQPPRAWDRTAANVVVADEDVKVVHDAIDGLPPIQRLVISLRDIHCWAAREVCELLEISPNDQRVLLHRARSTIRQQLETVRNRVVAGQ